MFVYIQSAVSTVSTCSPGTAVMMPKREQIAAVCSSLLIPIRFQRCIRIPESQELQELRQNIVKYSHFAAKIRKSVRFRFRVMV